MSVQNFSFLARLEVAEKFVVVVGCTGYVGSVAQAMWWGGGPGQVQGSALVKLNNKLRRSTSLVHARSFIPWEQRHMCPGTQEKCLNCQAHINKKSLKLNNPTKNLVSFMFIMDFRCPQCVLVNWHERLVFQSVGVRVVDWQRHQWPLKTYLFSSLFSAFFSPSATTLSHRGSARIKKNCLAKVDISN